MSKELEALRKIGLMTTKRNLQDFPIGNQPKQIVKMKIKEMPEFQEVVNALNELKRLKKFKETFDNYELAKKQDFIVYENWTECEAELKKLPTAEEDLELYKTPHERLLDMGFIGQEPFSRDYRLYKKGTFVNIVIISFNIKDKDYVIWKQDDKVSIEEIYPVNLELAEVLVDYLKELENDKKIKN